MPNAALKPAETSRRVVPASYSASAPRGLRRGARPLVKPRVISAPPEAGDFKRRQVVSGSDRDVRVVQAPGAGEATTGPRLLRRAAQSAPALPPLFQKIIKGVLHSRTVGLM
eukprot:s43_g15.t1